MRLHEIARKKYFERKQRDFPIADGNPDYVRHEELYIGKHHLGFLDGAEWVCEELLKTPLKELIEKSVSPKVRKEKTT